MSVRAMILVDGENLVHRYEASLKSGKFPAPDVTHEKGAFLWHPHITKLFHVELIRVSYYTTFCGDERAIENLNRRISTIRYEFSSPSATGGHGTICPHVFKKEKGRAKTKSVDISIVIDALRHTYNDSVDIVFLLAGDGDYLPLIKEIMRQGKQVILGAFSNGLNPALPYTVDDFFDFDGMFLLEKE